MERWKWGKPRKIKMEEGKREDIKRGVVKGGKEERKEDKKERKEGWQEGRLCVAA